MIHDIQHIKKENKIQKTNMGTLPFVKELTNRIDKILKKHNVMTVFNIQKKLGIIIRNSTFKMKTLGYAKGIPC